MNVGLPLVDADEKGLLIWQYKRTEILLRTSQDPELETGGSVWHAAHRLSEYLVNNAYIVRNKRVLELGCGCGLVGLVAAALGAKSVVLTDIDSQLPIIEENIEMNRYARTVKSKIDQDLFNKCEISCSSVWFGEAICEDNEDKYDVILGADIGYDISLHKPLASTIYSCLTRRRVLALLAEEVRWSDIYGWYIDALTDQHMAIHDTENDNINAETNIAALRASPQTTNSGSMIYHNENAAATLSISPESHQSRRSLDILDDEEKETEATKEATSFHVHPTVIRYPLLVRNVTPRASWDEEEEEVWEEGGGSSKQQESKKALRELIRAIYTKLNKAVSSSCVALNYRQSGKPIKVLKVTRVKDF